MYSQVDCSTLWVCKDRKNVWFGGNVGTLGLGLQNPKSVQMFRKLTLNNESEATRGNTLICWAAW